MNSTFWWSDWSVEKGTVAVKSTGHRLPLRRSLIVTCLRWLVFYACLRVWRIKPGYGRRPRIAFYPQTPRPWYFIWACFRVGGAKFTQDQKSADLLFFFEDSTRGSWSSSGIDGVTLNANCLDVSKSHVAAQFEKTFGYTIAVDPRAHSGPLVEKSEINGAHDGQIISGPCSPVHGKAYQRLVDNRIENGRVRDYRCVVVGDQIPLVFIKQRDIDDRFLNENDEVAHTPPYDVFSRDEYELLKTFASRMGLDWGAIDVLRDADDGRLYVVDVNKTNIDPPSALALRDKLAVTANVARCLQTLVASRIHG